jgi:cation transport ATPase
MALEPENAPARKRRNCSTFPNIRRNLFFALVPDARDYPIVAGVLYPVFGLLRLLVFFGVAATSLSSESAITNALRLRSAWI